MSRISGDPLDAHGIGATHHRDWHERILISPPGITQRHINWAALRH
jgi:hypothetical protein